MTHVSLDLTEVSNRMIVIRSSEMVKWWSSSPFSFACRLQSSSICVLDHENVIDTAFYVSLKVETLEFLRIDMTTMKNYCLLWSIVRSIFLLVNYTHLSLAAVLFTRRCETLIFVLFHQHWWKEIEHDTRARVSNFIRRCLFNNDDEKKRSMNRSWQANVLWLGTDQETMRRTNDCLH